MSHVVHYDNHYFRVEIAAVTRPGSPELPTFVSWHSDGCQNLKDVPGQPCTRWIEGPPVASAAEALAQAENWIKRGWDAQKNKRTFAASRAGGVIYTVWVYKGDISQEFAFAEFADAKSFAKTSESAVDVTKVGITNNESPQFLTVWERGK